MEVFVLMSLTMVVATCASGSEFSQARGMEDPWNSMPQQPEILIVKEKGGAASAPASSSSKMKDLTPILCLLAPLILAAIMIPTKMMMMNSLMNNMNGVMMPGMMNGNGMMMPQLLLNSALLSSGTGNGFAPLGFPMLKSMIESKKFSGDDEDHQNGDRNETNSDSDFTNEQTVNILEKNKENKTKDWYVVSTPAPTSDSYTKYKLSKHGKWQKKKKGDFENGEWSSRVWSTDDSKITLADEILELFDDMWNIV